MSEHDDLIENVGAAIREAGSPADALALIEELHAMIHMNSPVKEQPVSYVRWVPVEQVEPNDYNPNSVAKTEMRLLYLSILNDGYSQPVVTIYDEARDKYVVTFPCGHTVELLKREAWRECFTQSPILQRLHIPLVSSMAKDAYMSPRLSADEGSSESKCPKPQPTMENSYFSDFNENGAELGRSISRLPVFAAHGAGGSTVSTKPITFLELSCPCCVSSDPQRKGPWKTSQAVWRAGAEEYGLKVSWLSCDPTEISPQKRSRKGSAAASKASDTSAESLASGPAKVMEEIVITSDQRDCRWVIVDGFHRYFTCKNNQDIRDRNHGMLPIVVLDKDINDRMASTVRHNRARGKHSVDGMANMVFKMLDEGWDDATICNQLGMEPEELLRLKHLTGFSKLFENAEYKKAWETRGQIKERVKYFKEHPDDRKMGDVAHPVRADYTPPPAPEVSQRNAKTRTRSRKPA